MGVALDEFVVQLFVELLPYVYDAWQSGRVSRWHLVWSLAASLVLPVLAAIIELPVVRALLWGGAVLAWVWFFVVLIVSCREQK